MDGYGESRAQWSAGSGGVSGTISCDTMTVRMK